MLDIISATFDNVSDLGYVHALAWQASHRNLVSDELLSNFTPQNRTEVFEHAMLHSTEQFFIAYLDNLPIGMIILNPAPDEAQDLCIGEVKSIYFLPEYLGQGYGKELMDFGVSQLKEWNKTKIILWVLQDNHRARNFYQKYGYEHDGVTKAVTLGVDKYVMRYQLNLE